MGAPPENIRHRASAPRWIEIQWDPIDAPHRIYVNRKPGFPLSGQVSVGVIPGAETFTDYTCDPDHQYEYQVCVVYDDDPNNPACSEWVSDKTPPEQDNPPVTFDAPNITNISRFPDHIDFSWTASQSFDLYHVWWGLEGEIGGQSDINVQGDHGSQSLSNLQPDTAYFFKLQGGKEYHFLGSKVDSKWSPWSEVQHVRTLPPAPPALPTLVAPTHSGFVIQSQSGHQGNFEALVPLTGGLAHFWRDNDNPNLPWHGPYTFAQPSSWVATSLIQSNFVESGRVGNLEALAVRKGPLDVVGSLYHFVRSTSQGYQWFGEPVIADGKPIDTVVGVPALIQGHYGRRGNFEALVPLTDGLAHFWRDNDNPSRPWHGPFWVTRVVAASGIAPYFPGVALIHSNFGALEGLVVEQLRGQPTGSLYHTVRGPDGSWHTDPVIADGKPVDTVIGPPSLVQGTYGRRGNFEALVPLTDGLAHFWRDNDNSSFPWHGPFWVNQRQSAGGGAILRVPYQAVAGSLLQSNYGSPGNLEGLAVWENTFSPTGWLTHFVRGGAQWTETAIRADGHPIDTVVGPDAVSFIPPRQAEWRWCRKCQGLFFDGGGATRFCPAGGGHDGSQSGDYALVINLPIQAGQNGWRWCHKCQGLFFSGAGSTGVCPAGGAHDPTGSSDYRLGSAHECAGQNGWRWCRKCQGLFFSGDDSTGACPAGGVHDPTGSGDYHLTAA